MHKVFEFCGVVGDALATQETASVLGDQHIVLDADATEVLVGLKFVEVRGTPCGVRWPSSRR